MNWPLIGEDGASDGRWWCGLVCSSERSVLVACCAGGVLVLLSMTSEPKLPCKHQLFTPCLLGAAPRRAGSAALHHVVGR